jgi:hypothetical protein
MQKYSQVINNSMIFFNKEMKFKFNQYKILWIKIFKNKKFKENSKNNKSQAQAKIYKWA